VIGAGVTGLAAGYVSRAPVFEQADGPGGICRSYYVAPDSAERTDHAPPDDEAYRFEVGGGHWIFGSDQTVLTAISDLVPLTTYARKAAVRLGGRDGTLPYPLQAHIGRLGSDVSQRVISEWQSLPVGARTPETLEDWLQQSFGPTLCELFFSPFNERYTAGLSRTVAPQDAYKSPLLRAGSATPSAGYNAQFRYPDGGLDRLAGELARNCDVRYGKLLSAISTRDKLLVFADGSELPYDTVVSTVPLRRAVELAGLELPDEPDPYTSVLVLNIGALRGPMCPDVHWQYEPDSAAGFHRVGFYSNVDTSFLPKQFRGGGRAVSLYVERAYPAGCRPDQTALDDYAAAVVSELRERGYITEVHVVDPSWVDVAYTWRYPHSQWQERAINALAAVGIQQAGRYGCWHFQGIADSISDGYRYGNALAACS
jgi:protoporphyrinogen oxidase